MFHAKPFFQDRQVQQQQPPRLLAYIIYGGTKFPIFDDAEGLLVAAQALTPLSQALILSQAQIDALPDTPVDFTLLGEMKPLSGDWEIGKRCIVYGGTKFEYTGRPFVPEPCALPCRLDCARADTGRVRRQVANEPHLAHRTFATFRRCRTSGQWCEKRFLSPMVFRMGG